MALKVLTQSKVNRATVHGCAYSFSNVFHMFPESPFLYERMTDIPEMGGWLLCTTFSGDHWQGRGGRQWVLLWRTTRRKPMIPKGNSLKMSPRRKGMAGKPYNCSIPGTFLCSHSLILRLQILLLQLPSTLSSASSHLISSRSRRCYSVIPNVSSQYFFLWLYEYPCGIPAGPQQPSPLGPLGAHFDANGHLTCAVPTTSVQLVTYLTFTAEEAGKVVASSKNTDVRKGALINILEKDKKRETLNLFIFC